MCNEHPIIEWLERRGRISKGYYGMIRGVEETRRGLHHKVGGKLDLTRLCFAKTWKRR